MPQIQFFNGWTMATRPAATIKRVISLDVVTSNLAELVTSFQDAAGPKVEIQDITVSLGWLVNDLCELLELDDQQKALVLSGSGGAVNVINNDRILTDANIEKLPNQF